MELEFKKKYLIGIFIAFFLLVFDFYLFFVVKNKRWFFPILVRHDHTYFIYVSYIFLDHPF